MKNKDDRHPFKWLKYNKRNIRIDNDIACLLSDMWKLNINTTNSCQGTCNFLCDHEIKIHPKKDDGTQYFETIWTKNCRNNVWIVFEHINDLQNFLNLVAPLSEKDLMFDLIDCQDGHAMRTAKTTRPYVADAWSYSFALNNDGVKGHWGRPTINGKRQTFETWIQDEIKENDFIIHPQLTFPRKHLSYVEEKLKLALGEL